MQITADLSAIPQQYRVAIQAGIAWCEAAFSDPVSETLTFQMGGPPGDASANVSYGVTVGGVFYTDALAELHGIPVTPNSPDATVYLSPASAPYSDVQGLTIHEVTETLGRLSGIGYGVTAYADTLSLTGPFAISGDRLDWDVSQAGDAFSVAAPAMRVTWRDLVLMKDLGWHIAPGIQYWSSPGLTAWAQANDTVMGGGNSVIVGAPGAVIVGSSNDLVFLGTDPAKSGQQLVVASAGNETLAAGGNTAGCIYGAGPGDTQIIAGNGDDTIWLGAGTATIWTGGGNDLVVASVANLTGGTRVTLLDFTAGHDLVQLFGATAQQVAATQQHNAGGTQVTLPGGATIQFNTLASVSASDFISG